MINIFKLFVFFFSLLFSNNRVDGILAVVDENIVLHSDAIQQAQILASYKGVDPIKNPYSFEQLYFDSIDEMINQLVVVSVAKKDTNIFVSDDEIKRALDQKVQEFIQQAGSEEAFESMVGLSIRQIKKDYWDEIKNMLYVEKYKFQKIQNIQISRPEVEDFFLLYQDSLPSSPEEFSFSIIEKPLEHSKIIIDSVVHFLDSISILIDSNILSFDSAAVMFSEDPGSSKKGGYLGYTNRGTLVKEYEEVAYSLDIGTTSKPIKTEFGVHIIKVNDRLGEKISTQHILKTVPFSDEDKKNTLNGLKSLLLDVQNKNSFDSTALYLKQTYNNYSGIYNKITKEQIPVDVLEQIDINKTNSISKVFPTKQGFGVLFLYDYKKETKLSLKEDWDIIYSFALSEKQNTIFSDKISKLKKSIFIKKFY